MKNFVFIVIVIVFIGNMVFAQQSQNSKIASPWFGAAINEDLQYCENFSEYINRLRATTSNALQLTQEQVAKKNELIIQTDTILNDKFTTLKDEQIKLRLLQLENSSAEAIDEQTNIVNNLKKDIEKIISQENQSYKKILDSQQKSKLKTLQKLQVKAEKNLKHQKNYYKLNPKMREFAPKINN